MLKYLKMANIKNKKENIRLLKEIGEERINRIIEDAIENYNKSTEEEIYKNLGTSLIAMGLEPETDLQSKYFLKPSKGMDFKKSPFESTNLFMSMSPLSTGIEDDVAVEKGKDFWEIFKKKAKEYICEDKDIMNLIKEGKLKDALGIAIPPLLVAAGLFQIWIPVVATIVVSLIMMLIKAGIDAFCSE